MTRRFVTAAGFVAIALALTGCTTESVDPSVDQGVTAVGYANVTAGWQQLSNDAQQACQAQMMSGDVTKPAAAYTAAAKAYEVAWTRLDTSHIPGPPLPRTVPLPTAAPTDWCALNTGLTTRK